MFIGYELGPNAVIDLPASGLQNVIYIGAVALSEGQQSAWNGVVDVGPVTLTGPNYTTPSSALGGKDVALLPYGIHGVDCAPKDGAVIGGQGSLGADIMKVTLSHYGYVEYDPLDPAPLKVEWRSTAPWAPGTWIDKTSEYQFSQPVTGDCNADPANCTQVVEVTRIDGQPFPQVSEFRITPAESGGVHILKTDGLGAFNREIGEYEYNLRIERRFDLNLNGSVDTPDISVWVADPIDLNDDTAADSDDLADLVEEVAQGG